MTFDHSSTCDREELLSLLQSYIGFKSTENEPIQKTECLDWIVTAFLSEQIKDVQRGDFESSPWFYLQHPESKLLVFAHADVVPAPDDLFTVQVDGDRATGRGVSDMKGNMLVFLMAYRDSCKEGNVPPVSILITTDEEVAGDTIPHLLNSGIITETVAFTPDTNDKGIVCKHKGVCWSELIVKGKGGHGAYPWDTENPVWLLGEALEKIRSNFPPGIHSDWQVTASPTTLKGSGARNQVAEEVRCGIDIRFPPEECSSPEEALEKVSSVLPDGCELRAVQTASPLDTPEDNQMVQLYKQVAEEVLDEDIPFSREHGGTDARYFSEKGIPAFLYGPAGGGIHSDDEWVSISALQKHYVIYRELFARLQD